MLTQQAIETVFAAAEHDEELILVGGQAIVFWTRHYEDRIKVAPAELPEESVDIDYLGPARSAYRLKNALGGIVFTPRPNDHSPATAALDTRIEGESVHIDFFSTIRGLSGDVAEDAVDTFVPPSLTRPEIAIRVLNPIDCFKNKLSKAVTLEQIDERTQQELNALPHLVQAYIEDIVAVRDFPNRRHALLLLKQFARYLEKHPEGRVAHLYMRRDPIEVLKHFVNDPRLDGRIPQTQVPDSIDRVLSRRRARAEAQLSASR